MTSITETLRMALRSLRVNRMRALLTTLGIMIGIASVIAILTIGAALRGSVSSALDVLGSNNITVILQQRNAVDERGGDQGGGFAALSPKVPQPKDLISQQMIATLRERFPTQITLVGLSESVGYGQARDGRRYSNVTVVGANEDYGDVTNVSMIHGRFLSQADRVGVRSVAVVSDRLVDALFGGDPGAALGHEVKVHLGGSIQTLRIVGIYEYEQSPLEVSQVPEKDVATTLYIPVSTAKRLATLESGYRAVTVSTAVGVDPTAFADQLEEFLATYYENNPDYTVSAISLKSITEQVDTVMNSLNIGISVIAGISLVVGGIGVMNIMLVSVTERTREIGLRKAVGATPTNIRLQFLAESIVICLFGGVLGITVGGTLGYTGSYLLDIPTLPQVSAIAIAVGFSISIGIFFGYYPANRAAKLNPIEALRSL